MVIVEATTGSGKTEAALWRVDRWSRREGRSGMYVARPIQATSNQMFGRMRAFLERRYPREASNLLLLHGQASLSVEFAELRRAAALPDAATTEATNLFEPWGVAGPNATRLPQGGTASGPV